MEDFYSIEDIATMLHISLDAARHRISRDKLDKVKIGRKTYITKESFWSHFCKTTTIEQGFKMFNELIEHKLSHQQRLVISLILIVYFLFHKGPSPY